jgi:hypothetical protein
LAYTTLKRGDSATSSLKLPKKYARYRVCDPEGRKIGKVKEIFANTYGEPEYVRVKMGLFGLRSALIPIGFAVAIDEERWILTLQ